jgi:hypothetical protein
MIIRQATGNSFNPKTQYAFLISFNDKHFTTYWWDDRPDFPLGFTYECIDLDSQAGKIYEDIPV